MNCLLAMAAGTAPLLAAGLASAHDGSMMSGVGMWGGSWMGAHGGISGPILLVVAVVGLVALIVRRTGK
jgi:hypothetical protein